jgi:hypothetical protein
LLCGQSDARGGASFYADRQSDGVRMNKFLAGLAFGVPIGMIWADRDSLRARLRRDVEEDLRGLGDDGGLDVAETVNRIAEEARESASRRRDAMLNQVSRDELLAVYGIGPALTQRILDGRPYGNDHEVVENGIINEKTFQQLRRQVLAKHRKIA